MNTLLAIFLVVFVNTPPPPKPPEGLLDCKFDINNIYRCEP